MTLLLIKNEDGSLDVYSPETYGINTWGMSTQEGIDRKEDGWYYTYWSDGGQWMEDTNFEDKLDVIIETSNFDEILAYVLQNKPEDYHRILQAIKEIIIDYLDYEDHFRSCEINY